MGLPLTRPLRVVVSAETFVPDGMGGSETAARNVLAELVRRDDVEVTTLVAPHASGVLPSHREVVASRLRGGPSTGRRLATLALAAVPTSEERVALRAADVLHYPFTVPAPRPRHTPHVVSLLDMQHHDLPYMFSRAELLYRRVAYDAAARRADLVLTISDFSRRRIIERLGIHADRVLSVPLGVDLSAFDGPAVEREEFVLYPARVWPHKNHARLIEAMQMVRHTHPGMRLVLTGGERKRLGVLPPWVEHRGQVSESELRSLYARAGCLAFPSLYEGFGLPPLEAMAARCPVAAARSGSIGEVCGDAAVLFDPLDVAAIAHGIDMALTSGDRLIRSGEEQVRHFTWADSASRTLDAYRSVLL